MGMRKVKRVKRRQLPCTASVEISGEEVALVIVDKKPDGQREVRGHRSTWLREAAHINSDQGVQELTEALRELVNAEKLAGGTINVSLSSDFCVTRVLAGETDRILTELRSLRERSAHYLSLGAGPKEVSESIRSLDAKNSQAWLTVTNRETLDHVVEAIEGAGLYPGLIEHSMVSICRAVGRMGGDMAGPVIIIEPSDRGVDLGISYRGQLLFDYRPGGIRSKEHIAEIVEKHLERIQRYCTRFFRFASGQIRRVYLVGQHEDAEFVKAQFASSSRLTAEVLNPAQICPDWRYDEKLVANPDFLAPFGSALVETDELTLPSDQRHYPDLMDVFRSRFRNPLWPDVRRHLWPVAAAMLVGVCIYGAAMVRHSRASELEAQVAEAEAKAAASNTIRLELEHTATRGNYLRVIEKDVVNPPMHELIVSIVRNKPDGVFMSAVSLAERGDVVLEGAADTMELVYEFENKLENIPLLSNVHIDSFKDERLPTSDKGAGFRIKCRFTGYAESVERKASNG